MDIAIIGAGNVGTALAGALARAGHQVTISARTPGHATKLAQATGTVSASSNKDAITGSDVVIFAVPGTSFDELVTELGDDLAGKVVVDVSNRPTPDSSAAGTSAAEELQAQLPDASVVKAFNTAFATRQADPTVDGVSADGFVAADDDAAKEKVLQIVESIGFRPVDAGSLAVARTLEGMAWLNISRNMQGGTWQDAWVLLGPDSRS
ncbi:MAG TPA: NAD(P)-binding domain-containing protein [Methylomirabilota bacterium]|nr:NAD(P)-binding domain-containing protein [Methylomirabilota bacterium]